nr:unnamed protein product [Digitaria exilis]
MAWGEEGDPTSVPVGHPDWTRRDSCGHRDRGEQPRRPQRDPALVMGDAADAGHEGSIGKLAWSRGWAFLGAFVLLLDGVCALLLLGTLVFLLSSLDVLLSFESSFICARCPQSGRRVERSLSLYTSSDLRNCGLVLQAAPVLLLVIASITALPDLGGNGGGGGLEGKSSGSAFWQGIGEFGAVDDEGQVEVTDWEGAGGAGNVAMGCNAGGGGGGSAGRWVRAIVLLVLVWEERCKLHMVKENPAGQLDSYNQQLGPEDLQPCLRQGEWDRALEVQNGEAVATGVDTAQPKPLDIKRAHPELVIMLRGQSFFDLMGKGDVVRAAAYYNHHIKRTYPDDTAVCHRVFRRYNPAKLRFHQLRDPAGRQALCAASSQYVRKAEQDGGGGGGGSSHRAAHTSEESALPLPTDAGHGASTSTSSTERLPPPPPPVLGDAEEAEAASPEETPGAGGGTSSVN